MIFDLCMESFCKRERTNDANLLYIALLALSLLYYRFWELSYTGNDIRAVFHYFSLYSLKSLGRFLLYVFQTFGKYRTSLLSAHSK